MTRLRANFLTGVTTNNPLAAGGTQLQSPQLAAMAVVSSPDVMAVSLDPLGVHGAPEIVWVTDHAASATTATIDRHKEGTLARSHPVDTDWVNALTALDVDQWYDDLDAINAALAGYLPLAGGVMTGPLSLGGPPSAPLHAATKAYVDAAIGSGSVAWADITGKPTTFPPANHDHPAGDIVSGTLALARIPVGTSSTTVSRGDHGHSEYSGTGHNHSYLPLAGGTLTGLLTITGPGGISVHGGAYFGAGLQTTNSTSITSDGYFIGQRLYLNAPLSTGNNQLPSWRHNTAAAGLGWEFMRLTSSLRYKENIARIDRKTLIAELRDANQSLISWQDKGAGIDSPRYIGISAEDAYRIVPNAVMLDEKGRPDSVEPANAFAVHLIAAVSELLDRVDDIESRMLPTFA